MAEATGEDDVVRATVTVDDDGWFKAVSPQFLDLIGRPVSALAGVNLADLIHPNDSAPIRALLRVAATASGHAQAAVRLYAAGEMWIPVTVHLRSVDDRRLVLELVGTPSATDPIPATANVEPAMPRDVDADFPYDDSPEHMAYVALMPSDDVPDLRVEVRANAGDAATPMLEIDRAGRTVFVAGAWSDLTDGDAIAPEVFEQLLAKSGKGDVVATALTSTIEHAEASQHELLIPGMAPRWVRIVPIPSPHLAGVVHALIAIVPESGIREAITIDAPPGPAELASTTLRPDTAADVRASAEVTEHATGNEADSSEPGTSRATAPEASRTKASTNEWLWTAFRRERTTPAPASTGLLPNVDLLDEPSRPTTALWVSAAVLTYMALQGLYLGPAYGWPSPMQPVLDAQSCLVQPLCGNGVLELNHLAALALVGALVTFVLLFRRTGPRQLATDRPATPTARSTTDLPLDPADTETEDDAAAPGIFIWLSLAALALVVAQTLFADSVSTLAWLAASGFGAIAAWRSDRSANVSLISTMSALAVGLSCLLIPLGLGTVWLGEKRLVGIALMAVGLVLLGYALVLLRVSDSSFDRFDYGAMLGFSTLALVLGLLRHRTWRYAFIGDEWSFYQGALDGLRADRGLSTFDIGGPNDYFTGLTFELQAAVMQVAGDDVWGWRLSALMPMVLSVGAMYAFTRWLSGRTAAIAAAAALASGHMLLSFSMIGYNNSQSLVAVSASFAALAWAHQRPSALRFFLLGSAVGSTFLVYAMARLALLPIGVLFLVLFRHEVAALGRRLGWAALGGFAMAAPAFFSWENWSALLKATPVEAEDPVLASGGVDRQILENTLNGWLSFIGSTRNSHFIVGPHLDVISAVLLIIGLGYAIARWRTDHVLRWFLIGGVVLWTSINAIQQYAELSNTRSFMIPLVYCVFIGIGTAAVLPIVMRYLGERGSASAGLAALSLVVVALVAVNQWHIDSHANARQALTAEAMLVQQFEDTAGRDGHGMQVHVGWPERSNARLNMILRAHDVAAERIVVIPDPGTLAIDQLCTTTAPTMVVMHRNHASATEWTDAMAACWGTTTIAISDPAGAPHLLRVANVAGQAEFDLPASERVAADVATVDYTVADPIDVAVDGSGVAFALTRSDGGAHIHRLDGGESFSIAQRQPADFDITADGLFVVAANGADDRLVWYDGAGNIVRRYSGRDELPIIGGLSVAGDEIWISDTVGSRLLALDASGELLEVRSAESLLIEPSSVAAGPDGAVWVFSARSGEVALVGAEDRVQLRLPGQVFDPVAAPRLTSTHDGLLVRSIPGQPIVHLISPDGVTVDARGGTKRPIAATTRTGELLVVDPRWNEIPAIAVDDRWRPPPRGTVAWQTRSVLDGDPVIESLFLTEELQAGGPIDAELIETEPVSVRTGQVWRSIGIEVLASVHGIASDARTGGVAIADVNGRVVRLDTVGGSQAVLGIGGSSGAFVSDLVGGQNAIWALDAGAGRVIRINPDDTVTALDTDPVPLRNARGIGLAEDGSLWIASTAAAQLTNIAIDGSARSTIAVPGRQPTDVVAFGAMLWFVDAQEFALVQVDLAGVEQQAVPLARFTSLEAPHLVLVDDELWLTEPEGSRVTAVDPASGSIVGERIELVRPDGTAVAKPIGITATDDGRIWVVDSGAGGVLILDR